MFGYVKAKDLQQVIDSRQYWFDRAKTVGAALSEMERERAEALSQRDALLAILATATVRGERGRMVRWADTEAGRYWHNAPRSLPLPPAPEAAR